MKTSGIQEFINTILKSDEPIIRMRGYVIHKINGFFVSFWCESGEYLFTHATLDASVDALARYIYEDTPQ